MKDPTLFRISANGTTFRVEALFGKLWWKKWKPLDDRGWQANVSWYSWHAYIETRKPAEFDTQEQATAFMQALIGRTLGIFVPCTRN